MGGFDLGHHHAALFGDQGGEGADDAAQGAGAAIGHHDAGEILHDLAEALTLQHLAHGAAGGGDVDQRRVENGAQILDIIDQPAERFHLIDGCVKCLLILGMRIKRSGVPAGQSATGSGGISSRRQCCCSVCWGRRGDRGYAPVRLRTRRVERLAWGFRRRNTSAGGSGPWPGVLTLHLPFATFVLRPCFLSPSFCRGGHGIVSR